MTAQSTSTFLLDARRVDVDVDDLGVGREARQVARHAVVEPRANGDEHVALLHRVVGVRAAVHAEHVQGLGVVFVVRAHAEQRGGARNVALVGALADLLPGVGDDRPAADVEDGPLGSY